MSDTPQRLPVSDPYRTNTVFVNELAGSGILNGVVNLTFAVAQFTPNAEGKVDPDLVVASRLRMDMFCAQGLYARLGEIITATIKQNGDTKQ